MMKICRKCKVEKQISEFPIKRKYSVDGHSSWCKECTKNYLLKYRSDNSENVKKLTRTWIKNNRERFNEKCRTWRKNNLQKARLFSREVMRKSRATPKGNLNGRMSTAIKIALRENKAGRKWEYLVGYTVGDLKKHLERNFLLGMTWGNMGLWHIDHKIPISVFNYKKVEDIDFKRCWALKNLQPMWAEENWKKHNQIDEPFQPSLAMG